MPHEPCSALDMFGAFMLEIDDDDSSTVVTHDVITVGGVSDFVDPLLSFDTMSGFVIRFNDVAGGNNNDMSVFEYSPVSFDKMSPYDQLSLLDERRLRATDYVQAYQRKMTRAFRKRVKPRKFQKGDLVLKVLRGLISDPRGKFRLS